MRLPQDGVVQQRPEFTARGLQMENGLHLMLGALQQMLHLPLGAQQCCHRAEQKSLDLRCGALQHDYHRAK